jgi:Mce-associated membrane protein
MRLKLRRSGDGGDTEFDDADAPEELPEGTEATPASGAGQPADEGPQAPVPAPAPDEADDTEPAGDAREPDLDEQPAGGNRGGRWARLIGCAVLPALALVLACAAGYLKWQHGVADDTAAARTESVQAATDSTIALLAYQPKTVEQNLDAARGMLTGAFLNDYTSLLRDLVIPGSKKKDVSAVVTVPGAASMSATRDHAVVLLFLDQTTIVGDDGPVFTASSIEVTLDKIGGRWLISKFEPL